MVAIGASATVPVGYYSTINGKRGQDLKNAVHQLLKNHTVMTYSSLWYYFQSTDCHFENPNQVWDMYSNITRYFRGSSAVSGMNREHSFPKSWWGGTQVDAYTDLNHLYPSDGEANLAKNNYPLGEVSSAYYDNGCTKVGTPMAGQGGGCSTVLSGLHMEIHLHGVKHIVAYSQPMVNQPAAQVVKARPRERQRGSTQRCSV